MSPQEILKRRIGKTKIKVCQKSPPQPKRLLIQLSQVLGSLLWCLATIMDGISEKLRKV